MSHFYYKNVDVTLDFKFYVCQDIKIKAIIIKILNGRY